MNQNIREYIRQAAFAGGGALAASALYKLIRRKKATKFGLLTSLLLGGTAGIGTHRLFYGKPYDNSAVDPAKLKAGDSFHIVFSGAGDGEGAWPNFGSMRKLFKPGKAAFFRFNDSAEADKLLATLPKGVNLHVTGYSWGGKAANAFAKKHDIPSLHLIDPVSRFGNDIKKGAVVFKPSSTLPNTASDLSDLIATVGGRWNYSGDNINIYNGTHHWGTDEPMRTIAKK